MIFETKENRAFLDGLLKFVYDGECPPSVKCEALAIVLVHSMKHCYRGPLSVKEMTEQMINYHFENLPKMEKN